MTTILLIGGFVFLIVGAEALVRGASRIAAALGISPLIIGLTVVALGTSSPEIAVSIMSSLSGKVDIAVGNVVGSNIFNILFILGLAALIAPLRVAQQLVWLDVPLMIVASIVLLWMGWNGNISQVEGVLLLAGIIGYIVFLIRQSRKEKNTLVQQEYATEFGNGRRKTIGQWLLNSALVIGGLMMLIVGSRWLVESATAIAKSMGVSDLIIGLTIIAAGTSLPEVATSLIASVRGERDIAVGNAVGSNIFNILCVLGISAVVSPAGLPVSQAAMQFDIPIMIAVAIACLPIFFTGHTIKRWEGFVFLGYYIAYVTYLVLAASKHSALKVFDTAMTWFVIPLTVLTLLVTVGYAIKRGERIRR